MSFHTGILLALAGFVAGSVNALAGGGSLVSFPALIAAGYPAVTANVTNTVSIWPGYLSTTASMTPELKGQGTRVRDLSITAVVGAIIGSILLLALPDDVFGAVVPWLVLLAVGLLALQPTLSARLRTHDLAAKGHHVVLLHAMALLASIYGAYFGGGLGVILLAVLGVLVPEPLHRLNGLKAVLSLVINTVALAVFVSAAPIAWGAFLVVAPSSLVGGTAGAHLGRRLSQPLLRGAIVTLGTAAAIVMLVR